MGFASYAGVQKIVDPWLMSFSFKKWGVFTRSSCGRDESKSMIGTTVIPEAASLKDGREMEGQ